MIILKAPTWRFFCLPRKAGIPAQLKRGVRKKYHSLLVLIRSVATGLWSGEVSVQDSAPAGPPSSVYIRNVSGKFTLSKLRYLNKQ
jgi:hypothetical protein